MICSAGTLVDLLDGEPTGVVNGSLRSGSDCYVAIENGHRKSGNLRHSYIEHG